jgi:hypothetical protein
MSVSRLNVKNEKPGQGLPKQGEMPINLEHLPVYGKDQLASSPIL